MSEQAQLIEKRYTKQCDICFLIDSEAPKDMKWHMYREDANVYVNGKLEGGERYICDKCLVGIKEIRLKCHQKVDNPHHDVLKDFTPWFIKEIPGLRETFRQENKS